MQIRDCLVFSVIVSLLLNRDKTVEGEKYDWWSVLPSTCVFALSIPSSFVTLRSEKCNFKLYYKMSQIAIGDRVE